MEVQVKVPSQIKKQFVWSKLGKLGLNMFGDLGLQNDVMENNKNGGERDQEIKLEGRCCREDCQAVAFQQHRERGYDYHKRGGKGFAAV